MDIELFFDVVCPFAYVASTRIEALARDAGATVRYRPVLLGGLLRDIGQQADPNAGMPPAKAALVRLDARRQAAWAGVPLRFSARHPRRTLQAMRLLCTVPEPRVGPLAHALFRAAWVLDRDIEDRAVLAEIGAEHGADVSLLDAPDIKERLRQQTAQAGARGVFGVPTVSVGQQLWFGADRLGELRASLGLPPDDAPPPLQLPRPAASITWFHDLASPFSYLASLQIEAVLGPEVVPRPIVVGALFRDIGTPLVPLETFAPSKQAWARQDMERQARRLGAPFRFPSRFPLRSLLGQRVLCAQPRAQAALYRAAWVEDRDIADPATLSAVLDAAGFDGAALLARAEAPEIKESLRRNTEAAKAAGVCGVPSFLVDGTELFWGADRLAQVAHAARGWRLDEASP